MEILSCLPWHIIHVETDTSEYIRFESGAWAKAYNTSWELELDDEELEKAYQEFTLKQIPK